MKLISTLRLHRPLFRTAAASVGSCVVIAACGGSATTPSAHGATTSGDDGGASSSNGTDSSTPGTGDDSGSVGVNGDDSGTVATGPVDGAACPATGNEVVMIGDSYFALSETTSPPAGEITQHLQSLASTAGALASGDAYRHYYESGANMSTMYTGSAITPIPDQFAQGVSANPDVKYVIMDGGGNDILLENADCILAAAGSSISDTCKTAVQTAISAASTLFQSMKTAGVQKVIYFFYPHLPTTEFPSVNTMLDYAYPLVQAACQSAPLPCYFIDTRPAFNGNDASYIGPDNIHPTTAGSDVIAGLIWNVMKQECVALSP
jgi:lysophospholipase L1-like esterase